MEKVFRMWMKVVYLRTRFGGLAHLARALAWQARGDRFESGILHDYNQALTNLIVSAFLFYRILYSHWQGPKVYQTFSS